MKNFDIYLTRDTDGTVRVWANTEVGIRKWHSCIEFGSGGYEYSCRYKGSKCISQKVCLERYGFMPAEDTAYNVYSKSGKITKRRVDTQIDFSDYPDPKNGKEYIAAEIKNIFINRIKRNSLLSEEMRDKGINGIKSLKAKAICASSEPNMLWTFTWEVTPEGYAFWQKINKSCDSYEGK